MLAKIKQIAIGDGCADMHQVVGAHRPVFGIDIGAVIGVIAHRVALIFLIAGAAHVPALERIAAIQNAGARTGGNRKAISYADGRGDPAKGTAPSLLTQHTGKVHHPIRPQADHAITFAQAVAKS